MCLCVTPSCSMYVCVCPSQSPSWVRNNYRQASDQRERQPTSSVWTCPWDIFIKGVISLTHIGKHTRTHTITHCSPSASSVSSALQEGATSLPFNCRLFSIFPVLYHTLPRAVSVCQRGQAARGEDGWGKKGRGVKVKGCSTWRHGDNSPHCLRLCCH